MKSYAFPLLALALVLALASPVAACPLQQGYCAPAYAPAVQAVPVVQKQVISYAAATVVYPTVPAAVLQLQAVPIQVQAAPQFYAAPAVQAAPVQVQKVQKVQRFAAPKVLAAPAYAAPAAAAPAAVVPAVNVQIDQSRRGLFGGGGLFGRRR